jgi:predicted RNA-binding protein YlxR (DUF448 family)
MRKKKGKRPKHVPQRTCVGCKEVGDKRSFMRLVKGAQGIEIDETGKLPGRGVYLHKNRTCWEQALPNEIARGLRTELTKQDLELIKIYMESPALALDWTSSTEDKE